MISMTMLGTTNLIDIVLQGLVLALRYWWTWLPLVLGILAYGEWASYQRAKYLAGLKWTVLEIIPPQDIPYSSPRAADHFFAGLHATHSGGTNWKSQFLTGKVPDWFSFEIVSDGGSTHFYIRCPEGQRNVIESMLFAQYPDAEIRVVSDYVEHLPETPDLAQYDIAGAEMEFTKEPAYPIKTYAEFEEAGGKDSYERLDPLAPLLEIMSALRPGEHLWIQFLVRATGGDWAKESQAVLDKLVGKPEKPAATPWLITVIEAPFVLLAEILRTFDVLPPAEKPKEEKKEEANLSKLTPGQKEVLERVEAKLAKLAFKAGIRIMYAASKESFNGTRFANVTGMFKQLYYTNLNSFKPGNGTRDKGILSWLSPKDKGWFADERTAQKKIEMYHEYRERTFPQKGDGQRLVILTNEELATLWHMPALNVRAPLLPRVQAKKGQPPAILPTR